MRHLEEKKWAEFYMDGEEHMEQLFNTDTNWFLLGKKTLDPFVSGTHIGPYPYSDHDYTSLLLDLDQVVRGP